jgi:O-antigen ligase/tetratricopeptide (TPR) repeat protein
VRWSRNVGVGLVVAGIAVAPLVAGGVHRSSSIVLMVAIALGLVLLAASLGLSKRSLRISAAVALPLALLLVPVVQSIPLPLGLRAHLDPKGTELLRDVSLHPPLAWPLSLDPASTRVIVGEAAAALAAFLVAFHLASSQTRRHLITRVVAASGIAAVTIGLGHRILGMSQLYGLVNVPPRGLLTGPFVNGNHTSEFLELAMFACLACSFLHRSALNRIGWLVGAALCGGGALATMSRGAVGALAGGLVVFGILRYTAPERRAGGRSRVVWGLIPLAVIVIGAAGLGADKLVERFRTSSITGDIRFQLWREGLGVLTAHPFGIGRGAFDRIYPIYRSLKTPFTLRFSFLENQPLQLLVDSGWVLFAALAAGAIVAGWVIVRRARRDAIEAALLAGLVAVIVHSFVDFGFETLGVELPFMAVLGTAVGRLPAPETDPRPAARRSWALATVAVVALGAGIAATAHSSSDDMDALLKKAGSVEAKRAVLVRAQQTHPLDYFYALSYAQTEPLKLTTAAPSPRLRALNRALRLCGSCEIVHAEVASNLWRLGLRGQALLEWRTAVEIQPTLLRPMLAQLFAAGAKPTELAALGTSDPIRMTEIADFLSSASRIPDAFVVLDQADAMGAPKTETLLVRGKLQTQVGDLAGSKATIAAARSLAVRDPRLEILEAQYLAASEGVKGADRALAILDAAATRYPGDLAVVRERGALVLRFEKWHAAARAVDGLKRALHEARYPLSEAHIVDARIHARLGRITLALGEYRLALAEDSRNTGLWLEMGQVAENAGRTATAAEAYREAARLSPNSPETTAALKRIQGRERSARTLLAPADSP